MPSRKLSACWDTSGLKLSSPSFGFSQWINVNSTSRMAMRCQEHGLKPSKYCTRVDKETIQGFFFQGLGVMYIVDVFWISSSLKGVKVMNSTQQFCSYWSTSPEGGGVQCGLTLLGTDSFPLKMDGWKMMRLMSFTKWSGNFRKHSFIFRGRYTAFHI